jgi:hypothetical protein
VRWLIGQDDDLPDCPEMGSPDHKATIAARKKALEFFVELSPLSIHAATKGRSCIVGW